MFSILFFSFIATIQKKEHLFETLCLFFFKKFLKFFMNIDPPKEEVMELLPFIIGKAILMAFEEKIKEKLTAVLRSNIEESEIAR